MLSRSSLHATVLERRSSNAGCVTTRCRPFTHISAFPELPVSVIETVLDMATPTMARYAPPRPVERGAVEQFPTICRALLWPARRNLLKVVRITSKAQMDGLVAFLDDYAPACSMVVSVHLNFLSKNISPEDTRDMANRLLEKLTALGTLIFDGSPHTFPSMVEGAIPHLGGLGVTRFAAQPMWEDVIGRTVTEAAGMSLWRMPRQLGQAIVDVLGALGPSLVHLRLMFECHLKMPSTPMQPLPHLTWIDMPSLGCYELQAAICSQASEHISSLRACLDDAGIALVPVQVRQGIREVTLFVIDDGAALDVSDVSSFASATTMMLWGAVVDEDLVRSVPLGVERLAFQSPQRGQALHIVEALGDDAWAPSLTHLNVQAYWPLSAFDAGPEQCVLKDIRGACERRGVAFLDDFDSRQEWA